VATRKGESDLGFSEGEGKGWEREKGKAGGGWGWRLERRKVI